MFEREGISKQGRQYDVICKYMIWGILVMLMVVSRVLRFQYSKNTCYNFLLTFFELTSWEGDPQSILEAFWVDIIVSCLSYLIRILDNQKYFWLIGMWKVHLFLRLYNFFWGKNVTPVMLFRFWAHQTKIVISLFLSCFDMLWTELIWPLYWRISIHSKDHPCCVAESVNFL